ncbi:MAG: hypothetical protein VB877_05680 [Pirellulaceae bacterium]
MNPWQMVAKQGRLSGGFLEVIGPRKFSIIVNEPQRQIKQWLAETNNQGEAGRWVL